MSQNESEYRDLDAVEQHLRNEIEHELKNAEESYRRVQELYIQIGNLTGHQQTNDYAALSYCLTPILGEYADIYSTNQEWSETAKSVFKAADDN